MAVEQYMDFAGVEGEATAPDVKGQVPLSGWSFEVAHDGGSAASFSSLRVTKPVDTSSPAFLLLCAKGAISPQAKLEVRSSGHPRRRLTIDLRDVVVESVSAASNPDPNGDPSEDLVLSFKKIWVGAARIAHTGAVDETQWFSWDLNTGAPAT